MAAKKPKDTPSETSESPVAEVFTGNALLTFFVRDFEPFVTVGATSGEAGGVSARIPAGGVVVDARKVRSAERIGQQRIAELRRLISAARHGDCAGLVRFLKRYPALAEHRDVSPVLLRLAVDAPKLAALLSGRRQRGRPIGGASAYAEVLAVQQQEGIRSFTAAAELVFERRKARGVARGDVSSFIREAKREKRECAPYWLPDRIELETTQPEGGDANDEE